MTRNPKATRSDTEARIGIAIVLIVGLAFVLLSWGHISAVFGDSDEGINGAVWAANAEGLRELGPIDSRMGGVRVDGSRYATHPPLIVIETALAETIAGVHEWASRAGAWIGTLVAIALLYRLLRAARLDPLVAGTATAATGATGMVFTYGSMIDTPVISFPFGVAVMLLWFRQWRSTEDDPAAPAWLTTIACLLAAISGWQAVVLVVLCVVTTAARRIRGRRTAIREAVPFAIGGVVGLAVSLAWTRWVYGDFDVLLDKYSQRSGSEATESTVIDMVRFQLPWLAQLLGVSIVGIGSCVAALWDRSLRPLAAMSLGIAGLYPLLFHQAAAGHQFWNYWMLLPTAVGFSFAFSRLARDAGRRAPAILGALVGGLALINLVVLPRDAWALIDAGHATTVAFLDADYPASQTTAWYVGEPLRPDAWIRYYSDRSPVAISTTDQLRDLASTAPDALVIVLDSCRSSAPSDVCARLGQVSTAYPVGAISTARDLASQLG